MAAKKYEIARQWTDGFIASLGMRPRLLSESDHWLSGWDAGYLHRAEKNKRLNEYLVAIGVGPMGIVTLQEAIPCAPKQP